MNITDPIRRRARVDPDATAIIRADDTAVTYRDLDRMIDAACARIGGTGLAVGQVAGLAIAGPDEFPALVMALALARMGIASANPALPAGRMQLHFHPAGTAPRECVRNVGFDAGWTQVSQHGVLPEQALHPGGPAICRVFASSGTSGTPKFAAISHEVIVQRVLGNLLAMGPAEKMHVCAVDFGITWGFCALLRALWSGGALVLTNPADALAAMRRHAVNSLDIAPVSLGALVGALADDATPLPSLRRIDVSGSALPLRLRALTEQRLCPNVMSFFGSTETGGVASAAFAALRGIEGAVGFVHAGVEVQAVDEADGPLPAGTAGRLRMRSAWNATGYLDIAAPGTAIPGNGAPPANPFRNGWFHSGDVGTVTADGIMIVNARLGDFINAGGVKVNPLVIEQVLLSLPGVTEAAAFGVPDRMGVTQIWAAIVPAAPVANTVLNALCREKLAAHRPKFVLQMKGLPRNANGKLLRDELVKFAQTQVT